MKDDSKPEREGLVEWTTLASEQDGSYPRPQLMRSAWHSLDGEWEFAYDDTDSGRDAGWYRDFPHECRTIVVPYPPESIKSGIADPGFHPVVWYRRVISSQDCQSAGFAAAGASGGQRLILHFGAVDYQAQVWVDGQLVGLHTGGQSPFSADLTAAIRMADGAAEHEIVVRAEDNPHDVAQPRGKQDWELDPHVIWYPRISGIWQPVWLEARPQCAIDSVRWESDIAAGQVVATIRLTGRPPTPASLSLLLQRAAEQLAVVTVAVTTQEVIVPISLAALSNGQDEERLLWSPEQPQLIDAMVTLAVGTGARAPASTGPASCQVDSVRSYFGIRSVAVEGRHFLLNDRPVYLRSVLSQGYWPDSLLAAPSAQDLRKEVETIQALGFNSARIHQKYEDPRFLFWADKLGLLLWGEAPAAYEFSTMALRRTVDEWVSIVERDVSHPSIVAWVPLNESWGVQHVKHSHRQQEFARGLVALTKALDSTRPVIGNDGWEQVDTDLVTIHDYEADPDLMRVRYGSRQAIEELVRQVGPGGRRLVLTGDTADLPVMLSEFGGIRYMTSPAGTGQEWGYSSSGSAQEFERQLSSLVRAVRASPALSGFCYTQLTDTFQEANGLLNAQRTPKLPLETYRRIFGPPAQ